VENRDDYKDAAAGEHPNLYPHPPQTSPAGL
jgi:hypothetical protein